MPPDSTDKFLTAPIRATRSFRRHLHLVFCQEPVRSCILPKLLGTSGPPRPPGPSGLLGPLKPSVQLGQLRQLKQLKQNSKLKKLIF